MSTGLFQIGNTSMTAGVQQAVLHHGIPPRQMIEILGRHGSGDWGETSEDDAKMNDAAVNDGSMILSVFTLTGLGDEKLKVWVITDAADDEGVRHQTTVLLPEEH